MSHSLLKSYPVSWPTPAVELVGGAIKQRNGAIVVLLMLVTRGIYMFYWLYKTSDELYDLPGPGHTAA